jgi:hypothetical protein
MQIELINLPSPRGFLVDGEVKFYDNGDIVEVKNAEIYIKNGIGKAVKKKESAKKK